jgi:predicted metal-dependent peptidase
MAYDDIRKQVERAGYVIMMDISCYYGNLFQNIKIRLQESLPTAGVYIDIVDSVVGMDINPVFFSKLSKQEQVGVLYHELMHVAYLHLHNRKKEKTENERWNYATDLAINCQLVKIKPNVMNLPDVCLFPKKFGLPDGQTADYYFDNLPQDPSQGGQGQGQGGPAGQGDHDMWGSDGTEVERKILERTLKRAADMTVAGKLPQHVVEALDALAKQAPKQWHKELKAFYRNTVEGIESTRTWSRPNRRYGLFEAGTKSGLGKKLVIGVDTSGSMSTEDIRHILAECHAMLKCGVEAKVMFFDTQVHSTIRLTRGASIGECGRGGTDFKDFFTHANKCNPDGIVVFSDMDAADNLRVEDMKRTQVLWVFVAGDRKGGIWNEYGKKVMLD